MRTRIVVWTLVAVLVLWVANAMLGMRGIHLGLAPIPLLVGLVPLVFWGCLVVVHIALGFFIWRDAKGRSDLLIGVPAWVWGLTGLTGGVLGLVVHWFSNCSRFVRDQTIPTGRETD